ncbi:hypothetical protein BDQ17DRAFT_1245907 [Cyathus striatus]|nr:hypothetical protein BDQ17DRAFT_1245907 [Cyathus striatus]
MERDQQDNDCCRLLMFFFGTMDVALGLRHNLEAFVYNAGGPEEEFNRISEWVNVMKIADYDAQTFVGDGILLYRCFVIYNRRWLVIIFPGLLWIGTAVCSILTIYIEATLGTGVLNQKQLKPFITGQLTLTLAMNILTTGLIVYRIWSIQSSTAAIQLSRSSAFHPYSRVLRTLIECGAIYTLSVLILFACYLASNNAQLGVSDSGITFNLIIIRVGRGTAVKPENSSGTSGPYIDTFITSGATRDSRAYPLHQVKIKTVTSVSRDGDDGILDGSDGKDEARLDLAETQMTSGSRYQSHKTIGNLRQYEQRPPTGIFLRLTLCSTSVGPTYVVIVCIP